MADIKLHGFLPAEALPLTLFTNLETISYPHLLASLLFLAITYTWRLSWHDKQLPNQAEPMKLLWFAPIPFMKNQDTIWGLSYAYLYFIRALYPSSMAEQCPNTSSDLAIGFTRFWALLGIMLACNLARVHCINLLGPRFSLKLSSPPKLETSSIYAYLRHPSYTFINTALVTTNLFYVLYPPSGGVLSCWLGEERLYWFTLVTSVAKVAFVGTFMSGRIPAEEKMMEETFGQEWREWKKRTWRVIPFVW
ncbi:hypothetical protein BJ508DRAFT_411611 [Ascobolus immersus RN42]|uniref:Protein-S-isoprenylcysteine O-methyltransferase n=1 Tax=Ascobolus immersus RN42 TaxID=1160509 RepID=A0A3N4IIQ0_ASCIM|nr:hypothetical protein BJ508DRAFT_411611 [Ascobolus immersus RN42]